jgi:siroheme synthase-like protein
VADDSTRPVHHPYPVGLVVAGRRCLLVGGGRIAARRLPALLGAGAEVVVVAPEVTDAVREHAEAGRLTWHARGFEPEDLDGVWLALSATGDLAVDAAVAAAATARRVWVASADDPSASTATVPSVVRQGDVVVTVSTGGRSPALAAWLRDRLAAEVGPEYGTLLDLMAEVREEERAAGRPTEGVDWRRALDSGILEDVRAGRIEAAREALRTCR